MLKQKSNLFSIRTLSGFIVVLVMLACSSLSTPIETATAVPTSLPIDSSTPTPAPTPTHVSPPTQIFSLENADALPPENLLDEVAFSIPGGGGGPGECPYYDTNSPTLGAEKATDFFAEIKPIRFSVCGWEPDEEVHVRIITPDGKEQEETLVVSRLFENYSTGEFGPFAVLDYELLPLSDQFGKYQFIFSGDSGVFRHETYVPSPELKMVYQAGNSDGDAYLIRGLSSNEKVQVALYHLLIQGEEGYKENWNTYHLIASMEFTADENGEVLIVLKESPDKVVAIGSVSGIVPYLDGITSVRRINPDGSCVADSLGEKLIIPTRLQVGDYAYVGLEPPKSNRVRSGPGKDNSVIAVIRAGTVIKIVDGPKCVNGANWWKITGVDTKLDGWTLEGEGEYWLVPCSSKNKACP